LKHDDSRVFTRMLRRTDGSVSISLRNFVGEGIQNGGKLYVVAM
jgi:hypothetical protein